jgi:hypothetical protein
VALGPPPVRLSICVGRGEGPRKGPNLTVWTGQSWRLSSASVSAEKNSPSRTCPISIANISLKGLPVLAMVSALDQGTS